VSLGGSTATGGGTDFTFAGATLSWDDNDAAPKTFDIAIDDDSLFEGNETIVLQLSAPTGATVGTPSTETVTILDNDVAVADLSIAKSASAGPYVVGDTITFTITVSNAGPQAAANVVVTDTLPTQTSLVSATPSQGSCSGTTTIICNLGSLDAGNDATITLTVNLTAAGDVTNTANVASDTAEVDAANNSSGATITIAAAVAIPALSSTVQIMLAALIGAVALGLIRRG
jgi:uncharacterized repeat protein (TIGR01451 family)